MDTIAIRTETTIDNIPTEFKVISDVLDKIAEEPVITLQHYLTFIQVSEETKKTYIKGIKNFLNYRTSNNIKIPVLTDLIHYKEYLESKFKPTTVKSYLASVKSLYHYFNIIGLSPDIAKGVKSPVISNDFKKDYLTAEQTKTIYNSITNLRDQIIFLLGVTVGLRTVEISRLDRNDVTIKGDTPVIYVLGKGRTEKECLPINNTLYKKILLYLSSRKDTKEPLLVGSSNRSSGRLHKGSISKIIKDILVSNGYDSDRLTSHSLRHSFVTLSLLSGRTERETQEISRHKQLQTLMIYSHNLKKLENKCSETVMSLLN